MAAFTLSLVQAARKYGISKPTILTAIRAGKIPALIIEKPHIRVAPKDIVAHIATIPDWRRRNGRKGGLRRAENMRAKTRKPSGARSEPISRQA